MAPATRIGRNDLSGGRIELDSNAQQLRYRPGWRKANVVSAPVTFVNQ